MTHADDAEPPAQINYTWQHPWLRIQRLIRSILEARRDQGTRPVLKATLIKALGKREKIRRAGCS